MSVDERPGCLSWIQGLFGRSASTSAPSTTRKETYHYRLRDDFLSHAELSFFRVLQTAAPANTVILAKVNLADLFYVPYSASTPQAQRNKIDRKHVDFLLCDAATLKPLAGIELDDSSHQRHDRIERDHFMGDVFRIANLPLLRFPARQGYALNEVAAQLQQVARQAGSVAEPATASNVRAANKAPTCPKCGSVMVIRTARKGARAGQQFYACPNYPNCQTIVALSET